MFESITPEEFMNDQEKELGEELWYRARKKIMIIDDDVNFRLALSEILVDNGYEVTTAKDGEIALNQLIHEKNLPDLILVDLMMPVKGGLEFRREQGLLDGGLADIPVVFVTGQGIVDGELCIPKPFDQEELLEYIKRFI